MKKKMAAIVVMLLAVALRARALEQSVDTNNQSFSFGLELSSRIDSQYVTPFGELLYNKPVIRSEGLVWVEPKGWPAAFIDVRHISGFDGLNSTPGDEIDFSTGIQAEWKKINIILWATYLDFTPLGSIPADGDQVWFSLEFDRKFELNQAQSITPSLCFEVPWGIKGYKNSSGLRVYPGMEHSWEIVPRLSICQKVDLCIDNGATYLQSAVLLDYRLSLVWKANKWLSVEPLNFRIMTPLTDVSQDDGRETETIFGVGVSAKF